MHVKGQATKRAGSQRGWVDGQEGGRWMGRRVAGGRKERVEGMKREGGGRSV